MAYSVNPPCAPNVPLNIEIVYALDNRTVTYRTTNIDDYRVLRFTKPTLTGYSITYEHTPILSGCTPGAPGYRRTTTKYHPASYLEYDKIETDQQGCTFSRGLYYEWEEYGQKVTDSLFPSVTGKAVLGSTRVISKVPNGNVISGDFYDRVEFYKNGVYLTTSPTSSGNQRIVDSHRWWCGDEKTCPPGTCQVDCGSVYCCYGSDGIAVSSFSK